MEPDQRHTFRRELRADAARVTAPQPAPVTHVIYCRGCNRAWTADDGPSLAAIPEFGPPGECACECADDQDSRYEDWVVDPCIFTRDQLIEAISHLEAYPATLKSGRVVISAESMADALIEGLEASGD